LIFLTFSIFFSLKFFPVIIKEPRLAPPGAPLPSLTSITVQPPIGLNYIVGENIIFTAEFDDGGASCKLLIDDSPSFSSCDYDDQTDCLAEGDIVSGGSITLTAEADLTWYAQVCNSAGCDSTYPGEVFELHSDQDTNETWADQWHLDVEMISDCENKGPDEIAPNRFSCEIQYDNPYDCMENLTYSNLQDPNGENSDFALFASKKDCLHGALKYFFEVPNNLERINFTWEGYFKDPLSSLPHEGKLYIYDYSESNFVELYSTNSQTEVSFSGNIFYYENLEDYISNNIVTFLAWDYEGITAGITHAECVQNVCTEVPGEGQDQCDSASDCATPKLREIDDQEIDPPRLSPPGEWYYDYIYNDYVMLEIETKGDASTGSVTVVECENQNDCDDSFDCTEDICNVNSECENNPAHSYCNDNLYCNGEETCDPITGDPITGCQVGTGPQLDDGVDCTDDDCVEEGSGLGHITHYFNDSNCDDGNPFTINICGPLACIYDQIQENCNDGIDNDGDNEVDCADQDCSSASNCQSTPPDDDDDDYITHSYNYPDCNDGRDNDNDGCTDFPDDPGCMSPTDNSEAELACEPSLPCRDECAKDQKVCIDDNTYVVCRNYDQDPCYEWSDIFECPNNTACDSGICRTEIEAPTTELPTTEVTEPPLWKLTLSLMLLVIAIAGFLFFNRRRKEEEKEQKKKRKKKHKKRKHKKHK